MKKFLGIGIVVLVLFFLINEFSDYRKGYKDGYNAKAKTKISKDYLTGYWDGIVDGNCDYFEEINAIERYKALGCIEGMRSANQRANLERWWELEKAKRKLLKKMEEKKNK
mgnify:CR=1 FL=1